VDEANRRILFTIHHETLRRFARRLASSDDEADEIVQDLAVVVLAHRTGPHQHNSFAGWCCGIARHVVAHRRRSRARKPLHWRDDSELDGIASPEEKDPERAAIVRQLLAAQLRGLDATALMLLIDRFLLEKTASEMAECMKLSPASVRMRLARLLASLREPDGPALDAAPHSVQKARAVRTDRAGARRSMHRGTAPLSEVKVTRIA
jgi:RNA polymerase sigma factor (sigma-70 family)